MTRAQRVVTCGLPGEQSPGSETLQAAKAIIQIGYHSLIAAFRRVPPSLSICSAFRHPPLFLLALIELHSAPTG
jgi:hypothetical protein